MAGKMRVLIAPTAFKGTLTAREAARALAEGWRSARPGDDLAIVPIGDGGDGSLDMLEAAARAVRHTATVRDAFGRAHETPYAVLPDGSAFIETAVVAGIAGLAPGEIDVMRASTAGVGDLIRHLVQAGVHRIAVGVGGTSSHDVGIGMMAALGARVDGAPGDLLAGGALARVQSINLDPVRDLLRGVHVVGVCDVACPLHGPGGAAERFAAQKGASVDQVRELDQATRRFAQLAASRYGVRLNRLKHGGAGGGLAAGLHLGCGARLVTGVDWLVRRCGLTRFIRSVDAVVTGEGRFDETSLQGKAAFRLASLARRYGIPVLLAAGALAIPDDHLRRFGFLAAAGSEGHAPSGGTPALAVSELGRRLASSVDRQRRRSTASGRGIRC